MFASRWDLRPSATVDSAVTEVPLADSVIAWAQPLVTIALAVMAALTVQPLGSSGRGLYGLILLLGCTALAFLRSVPDRFVPPEARFAAAVAAAVLAGLLFGFDSASWGVSFAYLFCGHAGYRFRPPAAALVAGLCVAVCLSALLVHSREDAWPWWTALTVWGPALTGLARQNRAATLAAASELVAATRRATESQRQASALAERTRVARDIHDVLAHSLSGVSMQLDLADALLESGRIEEGRAGVQAARGLVVEGLVEARRAVQALRDGALEVTESLTRMVQPGEELRLHGNLDDLAAPLAQATIRTVQEALTNARRYAPGAPVLVEVSRTSDAVVAEVVDSGARGDRPPSQGGGMGLVGLRERVAELAGECTIGPVSEGAHAGGWRVRAVLPANPGGAVPAEPDGAGSVRPGGADSANRTADS